MEKIACLKRCFKENANPKRQDGQVLVKSLVWYDSFPIKGKGDINVLAYLHNSEVDCWNSSNMSEVGDFLYLPI